MTAMLSVASAATLILVSVEDVLRWHPLPPQVKSDGLVYVGATTFQGGRRQPLTPLDVAALEDHAPGLAAVAGVMPGPCMLTDDHNQRFKARCAYVSPTFWQVLGVDLERPILPFRSTGSTRAAVVSRRFWQQRLGARADVRGLTLTTKELDLTTLVVAPRQTPIVALAPDQFHVPGDTDVWIATPPVQDGHVAVLQTFEIWARLQRETTLAAVRPQIIRAVRGSADAADVSTAGVDLVVRPLTDVLVADGNRASTVLLVTAIGMLATAWLAVATWFSAMLVARQRDHALRAALGAGSWRLFGPLALQVVGVGAVGWALSLGLARWGLAVVGAHWPLLDETYVGLRPFSLMVSAGFMAVGICLSGLWLCRSVHRATSRSLSDRGLRIGGDQSRGQRRRRRTLFAVSIAIVTACMYLAWLLVLVFTRVYHRDLGFEARHMTAIALVLPWDPQRPPTDTALFYQDVVARVRAVPAVRAVTLLNGGFSSTRSVVPVTDPGTGRMTLAQDYRVDAEFFRALGARRHAGELLGDHESEIVVNEKFAVDWWGDAARAVGERVDLLGLRRTVVGVIADIRDQDLRTPSVPQVFRLGTGDTVIVRTEEPFTPATFDAVTAAIRGARPDVRISSASSYEQRRWALTRVERARATVMILFASASLGIGLFALWSHARHLVVSERHAAGVVRALGGGGRSVLTFVFGPLLVVIAVGASLGLGLGVAVADLLRTQLLEVRAWEPVAAAWSAGTIAASVTSVMAVTAHRLVTAEPIRLMREE